LILGLVMLQLCAAVAAQAPGPWKQLAKLTEARGLGYDWVGWSVAVSKDGNTVAVGAVGWCRYKGNEGCGQGAVFVFVKPASGWADMTETARLLASDGKPGDYLGESVAISDDGSTIVAGAPYWPANGQGNGALYVFVMPQGGWTNATENARLTTMDGAGVDLGSSVGISGNVIAGGGKYFNGSQGAAYVFAEPARVSPSIPESREREQFAIINFKAIRLFRFALALPLVETIGGDKAPTIGQRIAERGLRCSRF
jgi:hypothetical protein